MPVHVSCGCAGRPLRALLSGPQRALSLGAAATARSRPRSQQDGGTQRTSGSTHAGELTTGAEVQRRSQRRSNGKSHNLGCAPPPSRGTESSPQLQTSAAQLAEASASPVPTNGQIPRQEPDGKLSDVTAHQPEPGQQQRQQRPRPRQADLLEAQEADVARSGTPGFEASVGALERGTAAGSGDRGSDDGGRVHSGGDGDDDGFVGSSFLIRDVRTWTDAAQLLDAAGGQEGRPPPGLQLDLLAQSRRFRQAGPDGSSWVLAGGPTAENARPRSGGKRSRGRGGGDAAAAAAKAVAAAASAADAADDARWQAEWEVEWEVNVQRHAQWLLEPSPPTPPASTPHDRGRIGHISPAAAAAAARTAPAVMLPGHVAAAAAAGTAGDPMGQWPVAATPTAAAGPQFQPIPPMRALAGHQAPSGPGKATRARSQPKRRQRQLQTAAAAAEPAPAVAVQVTARSGANGSAAGVEGRRPRAVDGSEAMAAEVLLGIVYDAAVGQPEVWRDEQVAELLCLAARIVYRHPGLLSTAATVSSQHNLNQQQHTQQQQQQEQQRRGLQLQPAVAGRSSFGRNSAVAVSPAAQASYHSNPADGLVAGLGGDSDSGSGGPAAVAGGPKHSTAVASQLRVRLQQLLLRVDGMLAPQSPPGPAAVGDRNGAGVVAATGGGAGGGSAGKAAAPRLTATAAARAVWAAAALQLRVSPEGDIRRRLLEAFRPMRRSRRGRRPAPGLRLRINRAEAKAHPGQSARGRLRRRKPEIRGAGPGGSLSASDVADVLWAFGVLGLKMPLFELDRALRAVSDTGPSGPEVLRLSGSPLQRRASRASAGADRGAGTTAREAGADPQSAARDGRAGRGRATVRLGVGAVSSPAGGFAAGGLAGLLPSQLTAVAWAAVQLGEAAGREGVTRIWAARLFGATQTRLSRFSSSQLVDLVWSVGRGRRMPSGSWRRAAAAALLTASPRMLPWQVARAAGALAKLRLPVPFPLAAALLSSLHAQLVHSQPSDVAAMVWALPYITRPFTELFVRRHRRPLLDLAIWSQSALPSLEPSQLVQLVDGFARLQQLPGAEWLRLHREACIRHKNRFSESNRRKIRHAYAVMLTL